MNLSFIVDRIRLSAIFLFNRQHFNRLMFEVKFENALLNTQYISWDLFDAWYDFLHNEFTCEKGYIQTEQIVAEINETNLSLMLAGVMPPARV